MFRTKERIFKYETFVDAVQNKIPISQKALIAGQPSRIYYVFLSFIMSVLSFLVLFYWHRHWIPLCRKLQIPDIVLRHILLRGVIADL